MLAGKGVTAVNTADRSRWSRGQHIRSAVVLPAPRITRRRAPSLALLLCCALSMSCADRDAPVGGDEPAVNAGGAPSPSETSQTATPVTSSDSAVAVLRSYYAAIDRGAYEEAYGYWASNGQASGQSPEEFSAGFARTARSSISPGTPGRIEGAAGSRFIEIPAVVRAELDDGEEQCFEGSYTLVRSVVDGATPRQRSWRIYSATLLPCADSRSAPAEPADVVDVVDVVERFGAEMDRVSLLAEPETVRRSIREVYGPLVTDDLLERWLADPSTALGRETSSPWPDRIEVHSVQDESDGTYRVDAEVVYVSSADLGSGGETSRHPVSIDVTRDASGEPRIAGFTAGG